MVLLTPHKADYFPLSCVLCLKRENWRIEQTLYCNTYIKFWETNKSSCHPIYGYSRCKVVHINMMLWVWNCGCKILFSLFMTQSYSRLEKCWTETRTYSLKYCICCCSILWEYAKNSQKYQLEIVCLQILQIASLSIQNVITFYSIYDMSDEGKPTLGIQIWPFLGKLDFAWDIHGEQ